MARLQTVSRQFTIAADKVVGDIRAAHVALAKREHNKVMRADPRPVTFTRVVDGRQGAPEEAVRAGGIIVYHYPRLSEVVAFAMQALFDASPVDSGDYRRAHTLFLNGSPVSDISAWRSGDEIAIGNPLPYVRKIELGLMRMRVAGTDRVYERASAMVRRRYGNVAAIRFTFRPLTAVVRTSGQTASAATREARQPVIVIRER